MKPDADGTSLAPPSSHGRGDRSQTAALARAGSRASALEADDVHLTHRHADALAGVSLRVESGETVAVVGPNGSGKTSLLRILAGITHPTRGRALLEGRDLRSIRDSERALLVACMAQEEHTDLPFTAREVLLLAHAATMSDWRPYRAHDHRAVEDLADSWDLGGLLDRSLQQMSGGERRRVFLARAFAQGTRTVILDEPTNHLDLRYQHDLLERLSASSRTTVVALHDLDLAAAYCDRIVLMDAGRVVADGPPGQVLTAAAIEAVYGVTARRADLDGRVRILIGR